MRMKLGWAGVVDSSHGLGDQTVQVSGGDGLVTNTCADKHNAVVLTKVSGLSDGLHRTDRIIPEVGL